MSNISLSLSLSHTHTTQHRKRKLVSKNIIWFISNKVFQKLPIKQNMFYTSNNTEGKKERKNPDNKLWLVKIDNCRLFLILKKKREQLMNQYIIDA